MRGIPTDAGHMVFENRADGVLRKTTRLSHDQEGESPMSFFQKLREEKNRMYPLNRFLTYTVAPIYVVVCILLFAGAAIVLSIDENRFLPLGIGLMGGFVLVSVALFPLKDAGIPSAGERNSGSVWAKKQKSEI